MTLSLALLLMLVAGPAATPPADPAPTAAPAPASAAAPAPMEFESFQFVILRRPETPREYPDETIAEIQAAHLAHMRHLAEIGKLLVAGPLADQPDPRLRGLQVLDAGSIEEARRLVEQDPAIQAGRLEAVVMTWHTQKGALAFPMAESLRQQEE